MRRTIGILLLTLIGLGLLDLSPAEVTHEEIRGTIQSLIYSYNQLDNKLERHEHRERALGELMKKAMQSLQKGQKSLEPINGIFGRLDERVSQIETMLITQEEKYNIQTEKLGEALEHMFKWMRENDECYKRPPVPPAALVAAPAPAPAVPNEFIQQQEQINKELLAELKQLSTNVAKLLDTSKDMIEQSEVAFKSMPSTAEMLTKIEDKLVSYSVASAVTVAPVDNSEFEQQVLDKIGNLSDKLTVLSEVPKTSEGLNANDREFIQGLANETLRALEGVKAEALIITDKVLDKTGDLLQASEASILQNVQEINTEVNSSAIILDKFYNEMHSSYDKMNEGLEIFSKFNNILMTNSEYVLDTQRKVEFGSLQIVQKIANLLDQQRSELTDLLKERFGSVDDSIVNNQIDGTQNVSVLIESEIGQVWRRVEIMTGELADNTELLKLMQGGHEGYVNNTFNTMNTLASKVEETKARMLDMDSNLNYLLGKLSVMSQEFGNIKIGLGESLDELRHTFQTLKEHIPATQHNNAKNEYDTDQGRSPIAPHKDSSNNNNNNAKNQYETELNLLNKRHAGTD